MYVQKIKEFGYCFLLHTVFLNINLFRIIEIAYDVLLSMYILRIMKEISETFTYLLHAKL